MALGAHNWAGSSMLLVLGCVMALQRFAVADTRADLVDVRVPRAEHSTNGPQHHRAQRDQQRALPVSIPRERRLDLGERILA